MFSFKSFLNSLKSKKEVKEKISSQVISFDPAYQELHNIRQFFINCFATQDGVDICEIIDRYFPEELLQKYRAHYDKLHAFENKWVTSTEVKNHVKSIQDCPDLASDNRQYPDFRFFVHRATVEDADGTIYCAWYIESIWFSFPRILAHPFKRGWRRYSGPKALIVHIRYGDKYCGHDIDKIEFFNLTKTMTMIIDTYVESNKKEVRLC